MATWADNGRVTGHQDGSESYGSVKVVNRYRRMGNPRQGRLRVSIDGKAAAFAPLEGSVRTSVSAGSHTMRISLWRWYRSRRVNVNLPEGSTVGAKRVSGNWVVEPLTWWYASQKM